MGKRTLTSGGYHQFDYDEAGRITEASTQNHEVKLSYQPLVAWPFSDTRDGKGVEHVRNGSALETHILERFRGRREFGPARATLQDPTGQETSLVYDQGLVRRYCPNGTIETLQFDPEGRLLARLVYRSHTRRPLLPSSTTPVATPPPTVSGAHRNGTWGTRYHYTMEGDLVRIDDTTRGTTVFEVDKAHRLAAEVTPRGERLEYVQDAASNVLSKPGLADVRVLRGNFLASTRDERFEYNTRHHLAVREKHDGAHVRYHYDSFDMLVAIEQQRPDGNSWRWEASYDALGRRIQAVQAGKVREFFWDHDRLAAEVQPDGSLRIYQYASSTALIPIGFTDYESITVPPESGKSYVVFCDPVGLPLCIEDQDGNTVWWARRVDPYGAIQVAEGSSIDYNLRWPGHYYDPETGLHYNRWRYYDPVLGRYLQSDPLGYEGSPVNLYAYAPNPSVQVDLFGLECDGPMDGDAPTQPAPPKNKGQEGTAGGDEGASPGQLSAGARLAAEAGFPPPPKGYHWVDVGGIPRVRSNRGSDNPPLMYNRRTGEFQERPPEAAYPRVSFNDDERRQVHESGMQEDGTVPCGVCGEHVESSSAEHMDVGHKPGHEYAPARDEAIETNKPRSEFREEQKDLSNYRPEHPSCNRSHRGEAGNIGNDGGDGGGDE